MNPDQEKRLDDIEREVRSHDLWLRGDGQLVGVMPSVRGLIESCSRMEASITAARSEVQKVKDTITAGRGWIAGAMAIGGGSGALIFWLIEKIIQVMSKHP